MADLPSDAGSSTAHHEAASGRNSPASPVCLLHDVPEDARQLLYAGQAAQPSPPVAEPIVEGDDNTPRSEDPSAEHPPGLARTESRFEGFFSPTSHQTPPPHLSTDSATASIIEPVPSNDTHISHLDLTSIASSSHIIKPPQPCLRPERPHPQHTFSSASTASASTIRASDFMPEAGHYISRPHSTHPQFPNQAPAATLQSQQYPAPNPPPQLRTRQSNPATYFSYLSSAHKQKDFAFSTTGSRTAGNSPSASPGLFTPGSSPDRPKSVHDDQQRAYAHPFLRHPQGQAPKE